MSTRQAIRDWLSAQDGPKWGCEIIAAVCAMGYPCRPNTLHAMTEEGKLIRSGSGPFEYVVGKLPRVRMSAEHYALKAQEYNATKREARRVARVARQEAKRLAAPEKRPPGRPKSQQPKIRNASVIARKAPVACQSVADFLANGGFVERLPGFTQTSGYLPRRPQMARGVQVAP